MKRTCKAYPVRHFYAARGMALAALAALFLCGGCIAKPEEVKSPSPSPSASPSPTLSAAPTPSPSPDLIEEEGAEEVSSIPVNPVLQFYVRFEASAAPAQKEFLSALSALNSIDGLNALMALTKADITLTKGRESVGRLFQDGSIYSGSVLAVESGSGTIWGNAAPAAFDFAFNDGTRLYGKLGSDRLGYFILKASGKLHSMVRILALEDAWLVCIDNENGLRTVCSWENVSRLASFTYEPALFLPAVSTPVPDDPWGGTPVLEPSFTEEYWQDFTWSALTEGASGHYVYENGSVSFK